MHKGLAYPSASTARRWWPRVIDGAIVVSVTIVSGIAAYDPHDPDGIGWAIVGASGFYFFTATVLGLLYGWGVGVGQLICGVKSRRTSDGRRVGGFRGWLRYLGIAFLPSTIVLLADAPSGWSDHIRVYHRRGTPVLHVPAHAVQFSQTPEQVERFSQPDPYQHGPQYQASFQPPHGQQPPAGPLP